MYLKILNVFMILVVYVYSYYNTHKIIKLPIFPTLNIWSLMIIKILIMTIIFKQVFENFNFECAVGKMLITNIISSITGIIASSLLFYVCYSPSCEFLSGLIGLWGGYIIVNKIDSIMIVDSKIIIAKNEKILQVILYSNLIVFVIIQALLLLNIFVLTQQYVLRASVYSKM